MKLSFLFGSTFGTMMRLLIQHRGRIEWRYIPRFAFHLCISLLNSLLSIPDLFYRKNKMPSQIVFVMGHYRSGTTHLLNLLSADGTIKAPTTYAALFPSSFLFTERFMAPLMNKISPGVRAMDNMEMKMESPQEEEIAMAALGVPCPYLAVHFPITGGEYNSCVSFRTAHEKHIAIWKKAHQKYVRKLTRKYGSQFTLVLKSPANTARVSLLKDMYPGAKYVFIHRDPYRTIQSTMHLHDTWYKMANFQCIDQLRERKMKNVFTIYNELHERWIQDRGLIPEENRMEISFSELEKDPIATVAAIRRTLNLGEGNPVKLQEYLGRISGYRKNAYPVMTDELRSQIKFEVGKMMPAQPKPFGRGYTSGGEE